MSAYPMVKTNLHLPVSQPVSGAAVPGERVLTDGVRVLGLWGHLAPLRAELEETPLGQAGRQFFRWRGELPDEVEPEPGWTVEIGRHWYCVTVAVWEHHRLWRLDLERTG